MKRPARQHDWIPQRHRDWTRRTTAVAAALLICWAGSVIACAARQVREVTFSQRNVTVLLRGTRSGGDLVDRGFGHPVTIAPGFLVEILDQIRIRKRGESGRETTPLFPAPQLSRVAAGLSSGLSAAGPGQEVVVLATRMKAHLGVLRREYLTSLAARVQDGSLQLLLGHVDWLVPEPRPERLPEPSGRKPTMDFDLVLGPGIEQIARHTLRVDAGALMTRNGVVATPPPARETHALEKLSAAELRAMATLREARERGELEEREYRLLLDALLQQEAP